MNPLAKGLKRGCPEMPKPIFIWSENSPVKAFRILDKTIGPKIKFRITDTFAGNPILFVGYNFGK